MFSERRYFVSIRFINRMSFISSNVMASKSERMFCQSVIIITTLLDLCYKHNSELTIQKINSTNGLFFYMNAYLFIIKLAKKMLA